MQQGFFITPRVRRHVQQPAMKFACISLLATVFCILLAEMRTYAQVEEKERTLTWSNYKGRVPAHTQFAATTVSRVVIVTAKPVNGSIAQPIYIWCEFSEQQSWVNRSLLALNAHQRLLQHETNHYRLNLICAKRIKTSIGGLLPVPKKKLTDETARLIKLFDARNKTYDRETRYGSNLEKQISWENQISSELAALRHVKLLRP